MPGTKQVNVGSLKVGQYVMIDGVPCEIVDISVSKPGKHGGAKARVVGIGIFEKIKKEFVAPTSSKVEVPIIDRRKGQVLALMGDMVQIMDLQTYETLELPIPEDIEGLEPGGEVEYIEAVGQYKITRVIGGK
ncbi:translation initiation factor eIF-5A [Methanocaldococcus bathoardescens]|uniref:Translation initiation factor 5A n=1 Tax=Methanocaldococcus bathoardescens TaxID=1301915 RepID=A0A076LF53_9EURY|nr:translation initiation factor IF-5A [Methanocaldococcus bathoardescens]AIJ05462.1 translation initiation factor eIF-5A [Methanocaldococcus bathoardescens]